MQPGVMLRGGACENNCYHDTVLRRLVSMYKTHYYTFNVCVQVMY